MRTPESSAAALSRRWFLAGWAAGLATPAAAAPGAVLPSVAKKYSDPATEFEVVRWTDPAHAGYFPNEECRFVAAKHNFLIYASSRTGTMQAWRLDLGNGRRRLLTEAAALDGSSLSLLPGDHRFAYFAGDTLWEQELGRGHRRAVYRIPAGWRRGEGFALSRDGRSATVPETDGRRFRLRLVDWRRRRATTVLESPTPVRRPAPRDRWILYRDGEDALWVTRFAGGRPHRLRTATGKTGPALWSPAADSVLYLNFPSGRPPQSRLREYFVATGQDRLVARTGEFVCFGVNADATVFVGAGGDPAAPYVTLLLRAGGQELTLCEHRASHPSAVEPVFSPDSRLVFFLSDRDGHSSIYSMRVDDLVEATPS